MLTPLRFLAIAVLGALLAQPAGALPAIAQGSAAPTAVLSGTILDPASTPVTGATVTITGPASASTTSDSDGHFTLNAPLGIYRVTVRAPGFSESTDDDVVLSSAGSVVSVQLQRPTLSSLQTIGTVRSTGGGRGPQFNASAASQTIIGAPTFEDQGDVGVRNILDETPGIIDAVSNGSANGGVRGAITFPSIRGGLSYETATLIDGHALANLRYGDYVTTFLNRYMFQSIEVDKGPGSMPSTISRSVNGTVNFRTWDPTSTPTGNAEFGVDGFGGKFANLRFSDTVLNGKLGFVLAFATEGTPGPGGNDNPQSFAAALSDVTYTDSQGIPVSPSGATVVKLPGATNSSGTSLATNTIACCLSLPTSYSNRSELVKLRFNFSDVTSFTATMLAGQSYANQNGNNENLYPTVFSPSTPSAFVPSGNIRTFYPYEDNFAQDYETNNEPMFQAELHTQLKNDNILARFYSASISRILTNNDPTNTAFTQPVYLYGVSATGQPLNGLDAYGNPYTATISDPLYQNTEHDWLNGYTFEYDHALGDSGNLISFSADENYAGVHYFVPGAADNNATTNIPEGSQQNTSTYQVRGDFQIGSKLNVTAAYYLTRFDTRYAQFAGTAAPYTINFNDNILWHNDVRLGLAYRVNHNTSLRFSAGSSLVPPFLGLLNGSQGQPALCTPANCPSGVQPGTAAYSTVGGVNLQPETSFGYDLGTDMRFAHWSDTILKADVYLTNLHNQFLKSLFFNGTFATPVTPQAPTGVVPLYTLAYSNLADARYEGVEIQLDHSPAQGFGYKANAAMLRGFPYDVPPSIYQFNAAGVPTSNQSVVAGANFGPNTLVSGGGSAIPYAQGYAEINYRLLRGWYGSLGMIYYGPNNSYNEPAFEITRATVRVPIVTKDTYVQLAVDNLFNINPYVFDVNGAGVGGQAIDGFYYATSLKGYGPRNIHLMLVHNFK